MKKEGEEKDELVGGRMKMKERYCSTMPSVKECIIHQSLY